MPEKKQDVKTRKMGFSKNHIIKYPEGKYVKAKLYGNGEYQFESAPQANFGTNVWRSSFNQERNLFDKRYKPQGLPNMPEYSKRYSITGEFMDEGPLSSNDYFT